MNPGVHLLNRWGGYGLIGRDLAALSRAAENAFLGTLQEVDPANPN